MYFHICLYLCVYLNLYVRFMLQIHKPTTVGLCIYSNFLCPRVSPRRHLLYISRSNLITSIPPAAVSPSPPVELVLLTVRATGRLHCLGRILRAAEVEASVIRHHPRSVGSVRPQGLGPGELAVEGSVGEQAQCCASPAQPLGGKSEAQIPVLCWQLCQALGR